MVLELQSCYESSVPTDLWQVTIQSHDNHANHKSPEEIFLLNSVEQMTTGTDYSMQLMGEMLDM